MKKLQPLPHAALDYAWAVKMMSAPWLLGFAKNKRATTSAVGSGLAILGLSLFTRYPLGAVKAISFPVHGVIEATSAAMTIAAPWLYGFAKNKRARWTHVLSGLATLGVVAVTDYQAAERPHSARKKTASRSDYQISTAAEYDQYSARPPYTHYGNPRQEPQRRSI